MSPHVIIQSALSDLLEGVGEKTFSGLQAAIAEKKLSENLDKMRGDLDKIQRVKDAYFAARKDPTITKEKANLLLDVLKELE